MEPIELVPFEDPTKPVVYQKKVYQLCVRDWDDDCIMKDDTNGVKIITRAFSGVEHYDEALIETLEDHPFNEVKQIKMGSLIVNGKTQMLQPLVDKYYEQHH